MTFLPIASRELAVAARRPGTYRLRAYVVLIALVTLGIVAASDVPKASLGHEVLIALGVATLGFCMLAGLLLTANSIAAEKEGGTLGLLFLTDLKGYDVVLGKLAAHSVNSFFGLLAVFPVLAVPLLMGSVTGLEFSRMLLVFGTTLLFSASLGLAVSSMTRDSKQALAWAILLMAVAAGFLPTLWWLQEITLHSKWLDFLLWPSPAFALRQSLDVWHRSSAGVTDFGHSLQTIWVLTLLCLVWASFVTPRAWQHEFARGKLPKPRRKARKPAEADGEDPFYRVTTSGWSPSSLANILLAVSIPIWFGFYLVIPKSVTTGPPAAFLVCILLGIALHIIVKLLMMVESVWRLNHDRNSGALELLLVTPLPVMSIIESQRRSVRKHFRISRWALTSLNVAMIYWVFTNARAVGMPRDDRWIFAELFVGGLVVLLADTESLIWVGMWHGLSKKRAYRAVFLTAVQLLGPCWLFAFFLIVTRLSLGSLGAATVFALWFAVGLIADGSCLARARERLATEFRTVASERYEKMN